MSIEAVNQTLQSIDSPIWIVTSATDDKRGGLVSTTVTSISIVADLPRVTVGLSKQHATLPIIEKSGFFALHLIDEKNIDWVWRFGTQSSRTVDKFEGLNWTSDSNGCPVLTDAISVMHCKASAFFDIGDRQICLAAIEDGQTHSDAKSLGVQRMLELASDDERTILKSQLDADADKDRVLIEEFGARNSA